MLAVAVLAAMPAAARAVPHYYKNNPPTVEYPEGQRIPFIAWGRLTLSLDVGFTFASCETHPPDTSKTR